MSKAFTKEDDDGGVTLTPSGSFVVPAGSFRYVYAGESDEASLSSAVTPDDATAIGLRAGSATFMAPLPANPPQAGA